MFAVWAYAGVAGAEDVGDVDSCVFGVVAAED